MKNIKVTYICEQTGKKIISADGLPAGWIIPTYSLAKEDEIRPTPPKYTVIAFSSKEALEEYIQKNMVEHFK